jgi:hypothetical protein
LKHFQENEKADLDLVQKDNNLKDSYLKKIWIDLDNSPHVVFLKPIIEELEKRGISVIVTARDCFQVCELADLLGLSYVKIGHHSGKNKARKLIGLFYRALQLGPIVMEKRPMIALSHGSRSQMILARIFHIPSVCCGDYEPAKGIPLFGPNWEIVPDVVGETAAKMNKKRVLGYPGIKEDVYVPNFKPDPNIKDELGLNENNLVITVRPPATEAHYHNPQSEELFKAVINFLGDKKNIQIILLPRNDKQTTLIKKLWPEWCANSKIIIPDHVVDGLNLIWHSDLVVSGGGTMNREAASLGVPVYSIFRGKIGAVDRYLSEKGRLILIENKDQIYSKITLTRRDKSYERKGSNNSTLQQIVSHIVNIIEGQSV